MHFDKIYVPRNFSEGITAPHHTFSFVMERVIIHRLYKLYFYDNFHDLLYILIQNIGQKLELSNKTKLLPLL